MQAVSVSKLNFARSNDLLAKFTLLEKKLLEKAKEEEKDQTAEAKQAAQAKFIWQSNTIEQTGPDFKATLAFISHAAVKTETQEKNLTLQDQLAVLNTLDVLRDMRERNTEMTFVLQFGPHLLKKWHVMLCRDLEMEKMSTVFIPGELRTHNVGVRKRNGTMHVYPKHDKVNSLLNSFCHDLYSLTKEIETKASSNPLNDLIDIFALAAFAQYHFVSIHPFADGNGRLCRLLSQGILMAVLPPHLMLPMFENRFAYYATLDQGRLDAMKNPNNAPKALLTLMVDTALQQMM